MIDQCTGVSRYALPGPSNNCVLAVLGALEGERRLVAWGQQRALLTPKCFKFLSKMAVAAVAEPGRWIRRDELERGENQARYLYRLKGELVAQCGGVPELWENNRRGAYRMILQPDRIQIDWDSLLANDDWDLVAWVKSFEGRFVAPLCISVDTQTGQTVAA